jgi:hypothetical protein
VQVKKKVKEKKGRLPRPRIDIRREAIPSGFGLIVHGIHEGEKCLHLGRFMRNRMKLFSVRSTFFCDFFFDFFSFFS